MKKGTEAILSFFALQCLIFPKFFYSLKLTIEHYYTATIGQDNF